MTNLIALAVNDSFEVHRTIFAYSVWGSVWRFPNDLLPEVKAITQLERDVTLPAWEGEMDSIMTRNGLSGLGVAGRIGRLAGGEIRTVKEYLQDTTKEIIRDVHPLDDDVPGHRANLAYQGYIPPEWEGFTLQAMFSWDYPRISPQVYTGKEDSDEHAKVPRVLFSPWLRGIYACSLPE